MCAKLDPESAYAFFESVCRSSDHPTARFWSEYWLGTGHVRRLIHMIQRLESLVDADTSILDVGGFGELLLLLWKFLGVRSLQGASLEGDLITYGNGKLLAADDPSAECRIEIHQCNLERDRLKFPDDSLDRVTCFEVLEHLRVDPNFMLIEMNRILRPGGILFLSTPNGSSWDSFARVADFDAPFTFSSYFADGSGIGHCKEYSVGEFRRIVENAGFSIDSLETLDVDGSFAPLAEKYASLAGFVAGQKWWKRELRGQTQLVIARKTGKPVMRMYQPLYNENFFYSDSGERKYPGAVPEPADDPQAEITKLREFVSRLRDEVDARTRWAQSLENTVGQLSESRETLIKNFDERGEWSRWQDCEIRTLRSKADKLESEFGELKEKAARDQELLEEWRERSSIDRDRSEKYRELSEGLQRQLDALILRFDDVLFLTKKLVRALLRTLGIGKTL
jgi:SAM-dependent methyltransferase